MHIHACCELRKVASKNPDEMETQIEGDPPPSEHEGGEEEKKTDDEEVLPHHGDEPFCNDGTMDDEESKQKEGAEEEEKETDPIVYPDEETENEAEDDEYVGDEKIRKEKEGGAMKELGSVCFGIYKRLDQGRLFRVVPYLDSPSCISLRVRVPMSSGPKADRQASQSASRAGSQGCTKEKTHKGAGRCRSSGGSLVNHGRQRDHD